MQEKTPLRRERITDGLRHAAAASAVLSAVVAGCSPESAVDESPSPEPSGISYTSNPMREGWLLRNIMGGEESGGEQ